MIVLCCDGSLSAQHAICIADATFGSSPLALPTVWPSFLPGTAAK
jgi:hypothetical protein